MPLTPSQQQAVFAPTHSAMIANAGSGKTHTLVQKYLHALETTDGLTSSEIIAITFTENAAGELKEKIVKGIRERITELQSVKSSQHIIDRLWNALDSIDSSNISTIHAFCSRLLKQYPIEAGIDPSFATLDSVTRQLLIGECINSVFHRILSEIQDTDVITPLEGGIAMIDTFRKYGRGALADHIETLLAKRYHANKVCDVLRIKDDTQILGEADALFLTKIEPIITSDQLDYALNAIFAYAKEIAASAKKKSAAFEKLEIQYDLYRSLQTTHQRIPFLLNLLAAIYSKEGTPRKTLFIKKNGLDYFDRVVEITETSLKSVLEIKSALEAYVAFDATQATELPHLRNIFELYQQVLEVYSMEKIGQGFLDFDEMIERTISLLEQPVVGENIAKAFRFCFVDEYQDTDERQYRIVNLLSNSFHNHLTVSIVGDPKQSIYRFRDADLNIFRRSVDECKASSDEARIVNLRESFRMLGVPLATINLVTDSLFGSDEITRAENYYEPLILGRKDEAEGSVALLIANDPKDDDSENTTAQSEGNEATDEDEPLDDSDDTITAAQVSENDLIASTILEKLKLVKPKTKPEDIESNYSFKDVSILLRRRNELPLLELSLRKYRVPYSVSGGIGFYQQQEIIDLLNVLRFLTNTGDSLSLVAILRSPYIGIDDITLWTITREWHHSEMRQHDLWQFISSGNCKAILPFTDRLRLLTDILPVVGKIRTRTLLEHIIRDSQIELVYWTLIDGAQKVSNIRKLCDIASKGDMTVWEFIEQSNILQERVDRQQQAAAETSDNAVRIMTIHASKGLQFPIVVLPYLNTTQQHSSRSRTMLVRDEPFFKITQTQNDKVIKHPITELASIDDKLEEERESLRILYVGLTRAADHLILSATLKKNKIRKNSQLSRIADALHLTDSQMLVLGEYPLVRDIEVYSDADEANPFYTKTISTTIPIIREAVEIDVNVEQKVTEHIVDRIYDLRSYPPSAGITRYSPTQLLTYLECPTTYYLRYKLGLPEETTSSKLRFSDSDYSKELFADSVGETLGTDQNISASLYGQIFHKSFERFEEIIDRSSINAEKVDQRFAQLVEELHINATEKESYRERLQLEAEQFSRSSLFAEIATATKSQAEIQLRYALDDHRHISGIIDRIYLGSDGIWNIIDYKTTSRPTNEDKERYSFQVAVYAYLMCRLHSVKTVRTHLYFTKTGKTLSSEFFEQQLNDIESQLREIVSSIVADTKAKSLTDIAKNRTHCPECQYSTDGKNACIIDQIIKPETISII